MLEEYEDKYPQRQGNLEGPLVIVYETMADFLVVRAGDDDWMAPTQMFDKEANVLIDWIRPLGVWLKFNYLPVTGIDPPIPFTPEAAELRVLAYQAAKRARDAAAEE